MYVNNNLYNFVTHNNINNHNTTNSNNVIRPTNFVVRNPTLSK